jgi:hypothetical protein
VLGGCAELGLPGMWFTWADPFDIITAWRRVGVAGNVLAPELIDRSEFFGAEQAAGLAQVSEVSALHTPPLATHTPAPSHCHHLDA